MKSLPSNIDKYSGSGCMPVSATCVTWDGPNISCINLCNGDTIDVVIYELAKILCDITENVLDMSVLDFECLLENGECPPETLLETLQLIITHICLPEPPNPPTPFPMPIVPLPECLWYIENGIQITALPLDEYVHFLAQKICDILVSISELTTLFSTLFDQVQVIQNIINNSTGGGTAPPIINVTTQCLSGSAPGQILPIGTAFFNMEQALCSYLAILGTFVQWTEMFNNICITDTTSLPCGEGVYGDIGGWVTTPTTAAQSINNLWLVVCQLNDCMSETSPLACVLIAPSDLIISAISMSAATLTWVAPTTAGVQPPLGYIIDVYNSSSAAPIYSVSTGVLTTANILSGVILAGVVYTVKIRAEYECGQSNTVQVVGVLKEAQYTQKITYSSVTTTSTVVGVPTCLNGPSGAISPLNPYYRKTTVITVNLIDAYNAPLPNSASQAIRVKIRLKKQVCFPSTGFLNSDHNLDIAPNASSASYSFISYDVITCPADTGHPSYFCKEINTTVKCLVSATFADGASLPIMTALDVSLTNLLYC